MSSEKDESPLEKVSDVLNGLLQSIGLLDIVLGALPIYFIWILFQHNINEGFPSTGSSWLDALLLACAASAVGMLMSPLIALCMALGRFFHTKKVEEIKNIAKTVAAKLNLEPIDTGDDPVDYGATLLSKKDEKLFRAVDAARTRARACYGFAITLIFLFILSRWSVNFPHLPFLLRLFAIVIFFVIGYAHQRDYHSTLRFSLKQVN